MMGRDADAEERSTRGLKGGEVPWSGSSSALPQVKGAGSPWDKWGRLLGGAWIFFLAYPIIAALNAPVAGWLRYLAGALLVLFAAIYVAFFTSIPDSEHVRRPWRVLGALTAIPLAVSPIIGINALSCGVFIMSFAIFHLPLRAAFATAGSVLAAMAAITVWTHSLAENWSILLIATIVGLFTGITRYVIETSILHEETERNLLVVRERERVARDVHDILGHTLTVVSMKAELAERLIDVDPERAKEELGDVQSLSREAIAELRATVGTLRARRLEDELSAARDVLSDAGVSATVTGEVDQVDPRFRVLFAWVVREAVTNVVRHADATRCTITVSPREVRVTDDGQGLGTAPLGNGLRGLKERVAEAGGTVTLSAPASGGTEIAVIV